MSCSGEPMFGAVCTFACPEGWMLNGSVALTCGATGHWSGMLPTCEGEALIDGGCLGEQREERELRKETFRLPQLTAHCVQTRKMRKVAQANIEWMNMLFYGDSEKNKRSDMLTEF